YEVGIDWVAPEDIQIQCPRGELVGFQQLVEALLIAKDFGRPFLEWDSTCFAAACCEPIPDTQEYFHMNSSAQARSECDLRRPANLVHSWFGCLLFLEHLDPEWQRRLGGVFPALLALWKADTALLREILK